MNKKLTVEFGQQKNETAMGYLRRLVSNCNMETESLLDDLPSVQAVVDYFGLWHTYDTDFMEGIIECIEDGDNPKPYVDFVKKYNLPWETNLKSSFNEIK
ncbi:MAG: hypothetical protein V3U54_08855 [Thermodesulfobacteriota bacterium]